MTPIKTRKSPKRMTRTMAGKLLTRTKKIVMKLEMTVTGKPMKKRQTQMTTPKLILPRINNLMESRWLPRIPRQVQRISLPSWTHLRFRDHLRTQKRRAISLSPISKMVIVHSTRLYLICKLISRHSQKPIRSNACTVFYPPRARKKMNGRKAPRKRKEMEKRNLQNTIRKLKRRIRVTGPKRLGRNKKRSSTWSWRDRKKIELSKLTILAWLTGRRDEWWPFFRVPIARKSRCACWKK